LREEEFDIGAINAAILVVVSEAVATIARSPTAGATGHRQVRGKRIGARAVVANDAGVGTGGFDHHRVNVEYRLVFTFNVNTFMPPLIDGVAEVGVALDGTSMSSALVAGCIARAASSTPGVSAGYVAGTLVRTSLNVDAFNPGYEGQIGRLIRIDVPRPPAPLSTRARGPR